METLIVLAVVIVMLSIWTYLLYRQTNNTDADVVNFVLSTQVVSLQNENNNLKIENNILKNRVEILEEIENV
jgi:regulator of replication initiation timing